MFGVVLQINIALDRHLDGDPSYVWCARCGTAAGSLEGVPLITSVQFRSAKLSIPAILTEGFRAGFTTDFFLAVIFLLMSPYPDIDRMRGMRNMKVLRKAAVTIGMGAGIVVAVAVPANAASASAASSYF